MQHRSFLNVLSRSLPGEMTTDRTRALRAFERDLAQDFPEDALTVALATRLGSVLRGFPTYPDLRAAIQSQIGGQPVVTADRYSREIRAWLNALFARLQGKSDPEQRRICLDAFRATAPAEVLQAAKAEAGDLFTERDEGADDAAWWWDRVDRIESIREPSLRLREAKGMLAVLTRAPRTASAADQGAVARPDLVRAVAAIAAELEADGVVCDDHGTTVPRHGFRPAAMHREAPAPRGPSAATADLPATPPKPVAKPVAPIQQAEALLASVRSGAPGASVSRARLDALIDNYPGHDARQMLIRMVASGDMNGPDGELDQRKVNAIEMTWERQREMLLPFRSPRP